MSKFGYTVGFLIVILGRQQLFTENTLTPILLLLQNKKLSVLRNVARLWIVVLMHESAGQVRLCLDRSTQRGFRCRRPAEFSEIGRAAMRVWFWPTTLSARHRGGLVDRADGLAAAFCRSGAGVGDHHRQLLCRAGQFSHIIAGGTDVFYLVVTSEISLARAVTGFFVPTLIGNVIGGVALVAALAHAQFMAGSRGDHV